MTGILCCYDNHCNSFVTKSRNLRSLANDGKSVCVYVSSHPPISHTITPSPLTESSTKPMDSEMTIMNNKYETEVIVTAVLCVVVTTIVIATFISGVVYWCCCRKNRRRRQRQDVESGRSQAIVGYHRHNCCEAFIPQGTRACACVRALMCI